MLEAVSFQTYFAGLFAGLGGSAEFNLLTEAITFFMVAIIGGVAQLIDGSLGMGFGVFSSSILMGVGFAPAVAVAIVNAAKVFTGLASGLAHWRVGNVRLKWLLPLSVMGVVGGFLGSYLLTSIPSEAAKPWVSVLLLGMGLTIVLRSIHSGTSCANETGEERCEGCPRNRWQKVVDSAKDHTLTKMGALGFLAAFVNGLSGAYGPLATSGVLLIEKGHPRQAVGTVNMAEFFVAITVSSTILVRLGTADFPGSLVLALSMGGILAAPLAARICRSLPSRALAILVGLALIVMNVKVVSLLAG